MYNKYAWQNVLLVIVDWSHVVGALMSLVIFQLNNHLPFLLNFACPHPYGKFADRPFQRWCVSGEIPWLRQQPTLNNKDLSNSWNSWLETNRFEIGVKFGKLEYFLTFCSISIDLDHGSFTSLMSYLIVIDFFLSPSQANQEGRQDTSSQGWIDV